MKLLGDHIMTDPSKPWYVVQPCGKNKLSSVMKSRFAMRGITGKTNHSLRATGASSLFQAGILEKIIQEHTGHCSTKAQVLSTGQLASMLLFSNILSSTKVNSPQATVGSSTKPVSDGGVSFSTMFASASNCVINVNMATPTAYVRLVCHVFFKSVYQRKLYRKDLDIILWMDCDRIITLQLANRRLFLRF